MTPVIGHHDDYGHDNDADDDVCPSSRRGNALLFGDQHRRWRTDFFFLFPTVISIWRILGGDFFLFRKKVTGLLRISPRSLLLKTYDLDLTIIFGTICIYIYIKIYSYSYRRINACVIFIRNNTEGNEEFEYYSSLSVYSSNWKRIFTILASHNSRIRPKKRSLLRKRIRYPFPSILSPLTERDHSQLAKRISCRGKLSTARKAQNRTTHKSERSREDWPVNPVETNESRERRGRGKGRGPWAPGARMWAHRPS